ncbi:hypothetical protein GCM10023321_32710 [Pseudonocardia eucalypti]|uniref:Mce/MlaD domain-containing protein n=1 Tax=Pseudonocardia eucalypti TaxID=648755 RepID=A0ABP9Q8H1_9PSEU|nr:phospholipid/cholesterol/gamma-HCH transport system substrate-binding protein [Pseudonocardia eucalypti]
MRRLAPLLVIVLIAVALVGGFAYSQLSGKHKISAVLPNAIGIGVGSPVQLKGFDVGKVTNLEVRGDQAFIEVDVDELPEPLHEGTTIEVAWSSVLGHRYLQLNPGPAKNAVLPDGAMVGTGSHQVLVEELLEALDPPTRAHLQGMMQQLRTAFAGSEQDFNRTLQAAGPSVQALGAVLNGVGQDGQSIKTLVANLEKVTSVLSERRGAISSTILDLNRMTSAAAVHQKALSDGLNELPATLDDVKVTLDKVPAAADETIPLLHDLEPAADRLPGVAHDLKHVMHDLKPALDDLVPVLKDADKLLEDAPEFLDKANEVLPQLRTTLDKAGPAVTFIRPYTPEVIGFLGNWANGFATYDSVGMFARAIVVEGPYSLGNVPDVGVPGYWPKRQVPPGINSDQPWWDANPDGPKEERGPK